MFEVKDFKVLGFRLESGLGQDQRKGWESRECIVLIRVLTTIEHQDKCVCVYGGLSVSKMGHLDV